jgi:hypothetical protein
VLAPTTYKPNTQAPPPYTNPIGKCQAPSPWYHYRHLISAQPRQRSCALHTQFFFIITNKKKLISPRLENPSSSAQHRDTGVPENSMS